MKVKTKKKKNSKKIVPKRAANEKNKIFEYGKTCGPKEIAGFFRAFGK
jgi:hypothetical protein